jgi:hypothetical protein
VVVGVVLSGFNWGPSQLFLLRCPNGAGFRNPRFMRPLCPFVTPLVGTNPAIPASLWRWHATTARRRRGATGISGEVYWPVPKLFCLRPTWRGSGSKRWNAF